MSVRHRSLRRFITAMLTSVGLMAIGVLLLAWSGLYNVGASRGHWSVVEWFLAFAMSNSVATHAYPIAAPPLEDPDLYRLGAGHFHKGCAPCHGAPGVPASPIAERMLPPPPALSDAAQQWKDRELFWIVKHGIKYTGMPPWTSQQRDDEVWAVVAFLKQLPALDTQGYRDLVLGGLQVASRSGRAVAVAQASTDVVGACARCHGADQSPPASMLVPILHGQPEHFLTAALEAYASGRRESGIMQPLATELRPETVRLLASYYSGLPSPARAGSAKPDPQAVENGRALATAGLPSARIPPCLTCHGGNALTAYPRLAGQHAPYMAGRLRRWKDGAVSNTETDAIMAPIARRLSDQQIDDVSAYFSTIDAGSVVEGRRP